jgi:AraC family transcriptional regulator
MKKTISLEKGQYSGKIEELQFFNGLTFGATTYKEFDKNSLMHYHQNPHLSLITTGNHLEKRKSKEYQRKPGDILFCRAGESHQFLTGKPAKNINIELDYIFLKKYDISENQIENSILQVDSKLKILKMFYELKLKDENIETSIQILLLDLIKDTKKELSQKKPKWIDSLINILNDRWSDQITLVELSILLDVHPVTISKYFSKFFGCTFGEYRRRLKVSKSLELIKNSPLSVTEIAYLSGFADQSHFIRSFKSLVGFTPKVFQKW